MKNLQQGQSLFEVVVALAIVTLVLIAMVALTAFSIRNTTFSKNKTLATRLAQETIEWLRGERDQDWQQFKEKAAVPFWCLKGLTWEAPETVAGQCREGDFIPDSIFTREVHFTDVSDDSIEARVILYWTDGGGYHEVASSTIFTNW